MNNAITGVMTGYNSIFEIKIAADTDNRTVCIADPSEFYTDFFSKMGCDNYYIGNRSYDNALRFNNVFIPKGSPIKTAHITLMAYSVESPGATCNALISGEDTDNSAAFSTYANCIARSRTTATVAWNNIGAWADSTYYDTPEIKTIIQEIINREDWKYGNSITIFIEDNGSSVNAFRYIWQYNTVDPDPTLRIPQLYIEVGTGNTNTKVNLQVSQAVDDVTLPYGSGIIDKTTNTGFIGGASGSMVSAVRFNNVNIDRGRTIDVAYITLTAKEIDGCAITDGEETLIYEDLTNSNNDCCYKLFGEDADDAAEYTTYDQFFGVGNRPLTTAAVTWNAVPVWTGDMEYNSPDIKAIIQEIIDREGWESGNSMAFMFFDNPDHYSDTNANRTFHCFDSMISPTKSAKLHIEYVS